MEGRFVAFARQLRKDQTKAETKIWQLVRSKQINGYKFRRQQQIGRYIVDFVCFDIKLIIELDGSQHIDDKVKDIERDTWLKSQGFTVLRFWNNDVMNNTDAVMRVVFDYCVNHPPLDPPDGHGGTNAAAARMQRSGPRGRGKVKN